MSFATSSALSTNGFESRVNRLLRDTEADRRSPRSQDVDEFRRQESSIIAFNLLGLIGVLLLTRGFAEPGGHATGVLQLAFGVRIAMQFAEFVWLVAGWPLSPGAARIWAILAVWIHVAFLMLVTATHPSPAGSYVTLMLIPIVAAAFRFRALALGAVVAVVGALAFSDCILALLLHALQPGAGTAWPSVSDHRLVEAGMIALALAVVAVMLRVLVVHLQNEQRRLRFSLNALERTRDQMVANERMAAIGELAGAIAHEIRNPVAMIASSISMITGNASGGRNDGRMLDIIRQESRRLETLTTDFLAFARQTPLNPQRTSVATTLGYLRGLADAWAAEKGVTICVDDNTAADDGWFDRYQMQQALLNLLRNAVDATASGETVQLSAAISPGPDGVVTFHVANPGEPIPPEIASRMFEPFFTRKPGGTGLGLSIARKIAVAHGGQLELSINGSGWVCFSLTIPLQPPFLPAANGASGSGNDTGHARLNGNDTPGLQPIPRRVARRSSG